MRVKIIDAFNVDFVPENRADEVIIRQWFDMDVIPTSYGLNGDRVTHRGIRFVERSKVKSVVTDY